MTRQNIITLNTTTASTGFILLYWGHFSQPKSQICEKFSDRSGKEILSAFIYLCFSITNNYFLTFYPIVWWFGVIIWTFTDYINLVMKKISQSTLSFPFLFTFIDWIIAGGDLTSQYFLLILYHILIVSSHCTEFPISLHRKQLKKKIYQICIIWFISLLMEGVIFMAYFLSLPSRAASTGSMQLGQVKLLISQSSMHSMW